MKINLGTKKYINNILQIFPEINSITEIRCGNPYEIENCTALQNEKIKYFGLDVIDEEISENRQYFRHEKNKIFITLDASNETIPKSDIIISKNFAPHLPIPNIWSLLENIRDSQAKFFAFDYFLANKEQNMNQDLHYSNHNNHKIVKKITKQTRPINLSFAPFYFPDPLCIIPLNQDGHGLALYKIDDVAYFMDWYEDEISKLRSELFPALENVFQSLRDGFLKHHDGEKLFQEMMAKFLSISADEHNKEFYYKEPYKSIIDGFHGLEIRNYLFRFVYKTELHLLKNLEIKSLNENNFVYAQVLSKDYLRLKLGMSLWI